MADGFSLFDPDKAQGGSDQPDVGKDVTSESFDKNGAAGKAPLSVSALLGQVKAALAAAFPQRVTVVGELSNVKQHTSGHMYFRLKDADASIDAVMFRQHARRLKFTPTDGLEVVVEGKVDVYDFRGQLQVYAETMTPKGTGALELAFRQLREKLEREGLFAAERKKAIAKFPRAIGVVTSATGAALRDIRRTLVRRWPAARVYLVGVLVQGAGAAEQVAEAIRLLDANAERYEIDTIIVGRGGGSLEDLWAFNEEPVARAIFAARTPIISGVGHEVDVTIADLVADLRAPTPTGAAELATPNAADIREQVQQLGSRMWRTVAGELQQAKTALAGILRSAVFRDPTSRLRTQTQRLDELGHRLSAGQREMLSNGRRRLEPAANRLAALHPARLADRARARLDRLVSGLRWALSARSKQAGDALTCQLVRLRAAHPQHRLKLARQHVAAARRQLEAMSHRSVLDRGFSVTRAAGGDILRSTGDVRSGQRVETELADGKFASVVDGDEKPKRTDRRKKAADDAQTLFD